MRIQITEEIHNRSCMRRTTIISAGVSAVILLFGGSVALAQTEPTTSSNNAKPFPEPDLHAPSDKASPFRWHVTIPARDIPISVPGIVEMPLDNPLIGHANVAVYDVASSTFRAALYNTYQDTKETPVMMQGDPDVSTVEALNDNDLDTTATWHIEETQDNIATVTIIAPRRITTSHLHFKLAQHVAAPTRIRIMAGAGAKERIVTNVSSTRSTLSFPETTAERFTIELHHSQLLRISELRLVQTNTETEVPPGVRFLAHPGHSYEVYFGADQRAQIDVDERPNLRADTGVVRLSTGAIGRHNPAYQYPDIDGDGVRDQIDNCVRVANVQQTDTNGNGRGDACEDWDRDGRINKEDNCPETPNRDQHDQDGDGVGDACDDTDDRIGEKYGWLPWVAIGVAVVVFVVMLVIVLRDRDSGDGTSHVNDNKQ